jgi:hypothetical protein
MHAYFQATGTRVQEKNLASADGSQCDGLSPLREQCDSSIFSQEPFLRNNHDSVRVDTASGIRRRGVRAS